MSAIKRFLQYVMFDTTADPGAEGQPSSPGQRDLGEKLAREMRAMGIEDARVGEHGYVYGSIPATPGHEDAPALGLLAHMDTSPDARGDGVQPILHEGYGGGDVHLPGGRVIPVATYPELRHYQGQTLVTASGDTLLGADDKAGIAEILEACERVLREGLPHGKLCIAFTPDEEIGRGTQGFDLAAFGADFAYTLDGDLTHRLEDETFNAAEGVVTFTGVEVHPGTAKGIMVNAASLAAQFDALLPGDERPENSEKRQGFYHLTHIEGAVGSAKSTYILRDFDKAGFEARKEALRRAAAQLQARYGEGCVSVAITDTYYNMKEVLDEHPHLVENAMAAIRAAGMEPELSAIRGGTDGAQLSRMGLPCPNLGTGGLYFHGPNECISVQAMDKAVQVILNLIGIYAEKKRGTLS